MIITTPINPFGDDFRSEIETIAEEVEWWSRYRSEMERLVSEPRVYGEEAETDSDLILIIKTATALATNRWTYTLEPAEWNDASKTYITLTSTSDEFTAYNRAEMLNTSSTALNGYVLTTDEYTLAVERIPDDTPVLVSSYLGILSFSRPNSLTATCTEPPADAMDIPTNYVLTNGAVTSTSTTYAAITAWGDPAINDPNVFTFTKASGLLEAGTGHYLLRWSADASAVTNDAVIGVKAQYKIDAGSWTDIAGTTVVRELESTASYSTRIEGRGYVTVGAAEALDLRLLVARVAGAGTPTIASGSMFWETQTVNS